MSGKELSIVGETWLWFPKRKLDVDVIFLNIDIWKNRSQLIPKILWFELDNFIESKIVNRWPDEIPSFRSSIERIFVKRRMKDNFANEREKNFATFIILFYVSIIIIFFTDGSKWNLKKIRIGFDEVWGRSRDAFRAFGRWIGRWAPSQTQSRPEWTRAIRQVGSARLTGFESPSSWSALWPWRRPHPPSNNHGEHQEAHRSAYKKIVL